MPHPLALPHRLPPIEEEQERASEGVATQGECSFSANGYCDVHKDYADLPNGEPCRSAPRSETANQDEVVKRLKAWLRSAGHFSPQAKHLKETIEAITTLQAQIDHRDKLIKSAWAETTALRTQLDGTALLLESAKDYNRDLRTQLDEARDELEQPSNWRDQLKAAKATNTHLIKEIEKMREAISHHGLDPDGLVARNSDLAEARREIETWNRATYAAETSRQNIEDLYDAALKDKEAVTSALAAIRPELERMEFVEASAEDGLTTKLKALRTLALASLTQAPASSGESKEG